MNAVPPRDKIDAMLRAMHAGAVQATTEKRGLFEAPARTARPSWESRGAKIRSSVSASPSAVPSRSYQRKQTSLQACGKRLTLEKLHHQIVDAVLMSNVIERADVGMAQAGNRFRLTSEARTEVLASGGLLRKHFDRDGPRRVSRARYTSPIPPARAPGPRTVRASSPLQHASRRYISPRKRGPLVWLQCQFAPAWASCSDRADDRSFGSLLLLVFRADETGLTGGQKSVGLDFELLDGAKNRAL